MPTRKLVGPQRMAGDLGISIRTLDRYAARGQIPAAAVVRLPSGRRRFDHTAIMDSINPAQRAAEC
jgi:predicted site-specific integrase-resolvase